MASLRRKENSKYWIACFTDHNGRQRQRSTRLTNRKEALKRAEQWEEAYQKQITEAQARRVLADIHEELHGERLISSSVEDYVNSWLTRKHVENSQATYISYKGVATGFLEFLGDQKKRDLAFLLARHFREYRDDLAKRVSVRTANNYIKILRIVMKEAYQEGLIVTNPVDQVRMIKQKDQVAPRRGFSLPDTRKLLAVADAEWKGLILAGLYTGQRLGDLARLKWDSVDLKEGEIKLNTIKTGRRVVVPIATPLASYLSEIAPKVESIEPVFPNAYSIAVKQGKVSTLSRRFTEIMSKAGLIPKRNHEKKADSSGRNGKRKSTGLSFHSLRHTATSLLKNAGVSDAVARDIIGHESPEISQVYTHIDPKTKRAALEKMPDIRE